MNYRSEIDGLRAVALLPVILFHAGIETFRGGFAGVDVFFVISGYLITSIMLAEKQAGSFSLMRFYERRARRILPGVFVVTFTCLVFAWLWMLPGEMEAFSKSVVSVATFTSNLLFWRETGYFAPTSQSRPLLHTWSLAVEEQYYLLFPLFFLIAWRLGKRSLVSLLIIVGVISFAGAQWGAFHMPGATFYFLLTRGWELIIGVLVAFVLFDTTRHKHTAYGIYQLASSVGIALIAYAVFAFEDKTPWPSVYTLAPTLGTALVIVFAREHTFVGGLLSNRVLVSIGLISYGVYLWHYPLFAFARVRSVDEPSQTMLLGLAVVAMVLAYGSWKYVEQPIRNREVFNESTVFVTAAIGCAILSSTGLAGYVTGGFPSRWDPAVLLVASTSDNHRKQLYADPCHLKGADSTLKRCVRGISTQTPSYAIWGDSHAGALVHELEAAFIGRGLSFLQYTKNDCPASLGLHVKPYRDVDQECERFTELTMQDLAENKIETVIIASRWLLYLEGDRNSESVSTRRNDFHAQAPTDPVEVRASYEEAIRGLLRSLQKVILVYPVPESEEDVPQSLVKLMITETLGPASLVTDHKRVSQRLRKVTEIFDRIGEHPNLVRIKPEEIFCDIYRKESCVVHMNGVPLYFDDDHLSNAGARLVVDKIMEEVS
jgi:peptidoglycan/LPS O-acetylase OafA/YrhL